MSKNIFLLLFGLTLVACNEDKKKDQRESRAPDYTGYPDFKAPEFQLPDFEIPDFDIYNQDTYFSKTGEVDFGLVSSRFPDGIPLGVVFFSEESAESACPAVLIEDVGIVVSHPCIAGRSAEKAILVVQSIATSSSMEFTDLRLERTTNAFAIDGSGAAEAFAIFQSDSLLNAGDDVAWTNMAEVNRKKINKNLDYPLERVCLRADYLTDEIYFGIVKRNLSLKTNFSLIPNLSPEHYYALAIDQGLPFQSLEYYLDYFVQANLALRIMKDSYTFTESSIFSQIGYEWFFDCLPHNLYFDDDNFFGFGIEGSEQDVCTNAASIHKNEDVEEMKENDDTIVVPQEFLPFKLTGQFSYELTSLDSVGFLVSLDASGSPRICAGSLIENSQVLTTASCINQTKEAPFDFETGSIYFYLRARPPYGTVRFRVNGVNRECHNLPASLTDQISPNELLRYCDYAFLNLEEDPQTTYGFIPLSIRKQDFSHDELTGGKFVSAHVLKLQNEPYYSMEPAIKTTIVVQQMKIQPNMFVRELDKQTAQQVVLARGAPQDDVSTGSPVLVEGKIVGVLSVSESVSDSNSPPPFLPISWLVGF